MNRICIPGKIRSTNGQFARKFFSDFFVQNDRKKGLPAGQPFPNQLNSSNIETYFSSSAFAFSIFAVSFDI